MAVFPQNLRFTAQPAGGETEAWLLPEDDVAYVNMFPRNGWKRYSPYPLFNRSHRKRQQSGIIYRTALSQNWHFNSVPNDRKCPRGAYNSSRSSRNSSCIFSPPFERAPAIYRTNRKWRSFDSSCAPPPPLLFLRPSTVAPEGMSPRLRRKASAFARRISPDEYRT